MAHPIDGESLYEQMLRINGPYTLPLHGFQPLYQHHMYVNTQPFLKPSYNIARKSDIYIWLDTTSHFFPRQLFHSIYTTARFFHQQLFHSIYTKYLLSGR